MIPVALVLIAAALLYVATCVGRAAVAVSGIIAKLVAETQRIADGPEPAFSVRLADLEDLVERLPQRWEEFKNEARRAEGRTRALIKDVRGELETLGLEHAGLDEQGRELRLIDGGEREAEPVPAVREDVEGSTASPPHWRAAALSKKYGG